MSQQLVSLKVKCPSCHQSLMDYTHFLNSKPSIKLLVHAGDKQGVVNLCSSYGCFDRTSNIELVKDDIVTLICPHCKKSLPTSAVCEVCKAPILDFVMDKGGKVHVCSRIGCTKHYVSFDDIYSTLTSFYNEFDYGSKDMDF